MLFYRNRIVNTKMNRPVIQHLFPSLCWNGRTQILDWTYIIGCEEYSRMLKHYGTRNWIDLPSYTINTSSTWLKEPCVIRIYLKKWKKNYLGKKLLPVYTFLAFDLQDLGFFYFIKLRIHRFKKYINRIKNKIVS